MAADSTDYVRLRFGPFELAPGERRLTREGNPCRIQPQPLRLLTLLVTRPGRLLTREQLRRELWGEDVAVDHEHGLNFAVNQIRTVLGDSARASRYIETVPRAGYRFIAKVERLEAPPTPEPTSSQQAAPPPTEQIPPRPPSRGSRPRARLWMPLLSLLLVLVLLRLSLAPTPASEPSGEPLRLAVQPIEADSDERNLAQGLTVDLVTSLGRWAPSHIQVVGRSSGIRQAEMGRPWIEVAHQLGADFVVRGHLTQHEDRARVTLRLVRLPEEREEFTTRVDGRVSELLFIQQEAATRLLRHLAPETAELSPTAPLIEIDPDLYRRYGEARWGLLQGASSSSRRSIDTLREVVELEPRLADAQAVLAQSLVLGSFGESRRDLAEAQATAEAALELDPTSSEALLASGLILAFGHWQLAAGSHLIDQAIENDPSNADALGAAAWLAAIQGDWEGSLTFSDRVVALDPLDGDSLANAGFANYLTRRPQLARDRCERAIELYTSFPLFAADCLLSASAELEDQRAAGRAVDFLIATSRWEKELFPELPLDERVLGYRAAKLRRLQEANAVYLLDYPAAVHAAALGQREEALDHLIGALERRDLLLPFAAAEPWFRPLHNEPRFRQVLDALGVEPHP